MQENNLGIIRIKYFSTNKIDNTSNLKIKFRFQGWIGESGIHIFEYNNFVNGLWNDYRLWTQKTTFRNIKTHNVFYKLHSAEEKIYSNPFRFCFPPLILETSVSLREYCPALLTGPLEPSYKVSKNGCRYEKQMFNYNTISLVELNLRNKIKPQKWCNNDIPTITQ